MSRYAATPLLLWLLLPASAPAQQPISQSDWKSGYNGFAVLCHLAGLQLDQSEEAWRQADPSRRVLVVFGDTTSPLPVDIASVLRQGGAVLIASDRGARLRTLGMEIRSGPNDVADERRSYRGRTDCPVVEVDPQDHPCLKNCASLVTNRPGCLRFSWYAKHTKLAHLPPLINRNLNTRRNVGPLFLAALESGDSRTLVVADQTLFCNQMLPCGDNAAFAINALKWLKDDSRTNLLVISNRRIQQPADPTQLKVNIPPPSPREVRDALRQLPPEALVEFGNLVVAAAEDEGVMNELIAFVFEELPEKAYMRALILTVSLLLMSYLLWRFWLGRADRGDLDANSKSVRGAMERQQAARLLLDQFRSDVVGDVAMPWRDVLPMILLRIDESPQATDAMRNEITKVLEGVEQKPRRLWSRRQLEELERQVAAWRHALAGSAEREELMAAT